MLNRLLVCLSFIALGLTSCSAEEASQPLPPGANSIAIIGAIHGQHKTSELYSLDRLKNAIVNFRPDVVMVELPPDRFAIASENFDTFGEVRESRADDFPELTNVVFPLRKQLGFTIIPVAAWSQEIANDRREAEARLSKDPLRAKDWAEYQAAIKAYNRGVSGQSDDPVFINGADYDAIVKTRQETYEKLFGKDLGAGGWQAINTAHYALIDKALDDLEGQDKRILIVYGAWHKYWFLERLERRGDLKIEDGAQLFKR